MSKPEHYYQNITMELIEQIPADALRIIDIGCAEGKLGQFLKEQNPQRYIVGFEYVEEIANLAKQHLDEVYAGDIQKNHIPPHFEAESFDCIVCGDVLEHLPEATQVLKKFLPYLKHDGLIVACIPNAQHYSVIQQILSQNFQYHRSGLLDKTHTNLMTLPNIFKMFLDAGYMPYLEFTKIQNSIDPAFFEALQPVLRYLGLGHERTKTTLETFQYIIVAKVHLGSKQRELNYSHIIDQQPSSVISAINNQLQLENNLAISPDFLNNFHQLVYVYNAQDINQAWQTGLEHAQHQWIILAHQDVYLPEGWLQQVQYAWHEAEEKFEKQIAIAGVAGIIKNSDGQYSVKASCVDRIQTLYNEHAELPAIAQSLDELVLVLRRDRFLPDIHPELGFHYYATDMILKIQEQGFIAAILDVPCFHNSSREVSNIDDPDLVDKAYKFYQLWQDKLPIETLCSSFQNEQIIMK